MSMTPTSEPKVNPDPRRKRTITYIIVGVALLTLLVVGLAFFRSEKADADAKNKADKLINGLKDAGLPAPNQDQITRVLGDDGGAVCDDPDSALREGILLGSLSNGASGPGIRPVIVDEKVVQGERLIIKIYCPDELDDFNDKVDELKHDDVIKE